MPPKVFDLPDEVLDICLRELLPPTEKVTTNSVSVSDPHHLGKLMIVCKTFYRLALPWVWRHLQWPSNGRCKFLGYRPEVASHIRFFALDISTLTSREHLAPICAAIPVMTNLPVLQLSADGEVNWDLIEKLYITLVSRPHLHTLNILGYIPTNIQGFPSLTGLRRLHLERCSGGECFLLERTQFLESFAISSSEKHIPGPWTTMSVPWTTLRKLAVYDADPFYSSESLNDWHLILENYSSWKKSFPDTPLRLTQLFIALMYSDITMEFFTLKHIRLLTVFGPQLRRLCLAYLVEVNQEILDHIVDGFPHLHELHLLSLFENSLHDPIWTMEPTGIAKSLGKLSMLKRLNLNYVNPEERGAEEWPCSGVRNMVPAIGRACQSLEVLEFFHDFPGDAICYGWISFTILRDDNGGYESCLETEVDASVFRPLYHS